MSAPVLPVIFRAERSGDFKGEITAVFPTLPWNCGFDFTTYAHIGQHSGAIYGWYRQTRPATPHEYAPLLDELRAIYERGDKPVTLQPVNRMTRQHWAERKANFERKQESI